MIEIHENHDISLIRLVLKHSASSRFQASWRRPQKWNNSWVFPRCSLFKVRGRSTHPSRVAFPVMSVSASRRLVSETSRATHLRRGAGCTGSLNSKASLIAFSALIFYKASPLTGEANESTWNLHQSEPSTVAFHRLDRKYSAKIFAFVMKKNAWPSKFRHASQE